MDGAWTVCAIGPWSHVLGWVWSRVTTYPGETGKVWGTWYRTGLFWGWFIASPFFFSFSFLTLTELLIWRILSVTITTVPIFIYLIPFLAGLLGKMVEPERPSITVLYFVTLSRGILYLTRAVTLVLAFTSLGDATWNIRDCSLDYLYTSCIDLLWFAILSNPGVHKQIESNTFSS